MPDQVLRPSRKALLSNYLFAGCLLLLILNDHWFKWSFHNALTGKLSDIAGVLLLPLLLSYVFPRLGVRSIWISAILFTLWKLPLSQPAIDWYNGWSPLGTSRVVDYSDLLVLPLLMVPYTLLADPRRLQVLRIRRLHPLVLVCMTIPALLATSPSAEMWRNWYLSESDGNLRCTDCIVTLHASENEVLRDLQQEGITYHRRTPQNSHGMYNSVPFDSSKIHFYRIPSLIIDRDTLREIDFCLETVDTGKTRLYFGGLQTSQALGSYRHRNKLSKRHWKLLRKYLKRT